MGALDALIYGIRDLFSGAGATAQNRRSKLWLRNGFTVTDDDENGRLIVDAADGGSNTNVGGKLAIHKSAGALRTIDVTNTATKTSGVQGTDVLELRPLPPGWYNVCDYGATGDGVTDDAPAVRAALAAMGGSENFGGTLYFPQTAASYKFSSVDPLAPDGTNAAVYVNRQVTIRGTSSAGGWNEANIECAADISGFFFDYPGAQWAEVKDLYIWSTRTPRNGTIRQTAHAYLVGDKIRLTDDNRFYMKVKTAGTSSASATDVIFGDPGDTLPLETDITDGTVVWRAQMHAAIISKTKIRVSRVQFAAFTGPAIAVIAGSGVWASSSNANDGRIESCTIVDCGVGVYLKGTDVNVWLTEDVSTKAIGSTQDGAGGHAFIEHSFLGNTYVNCQVESCTGRGFFCPAGGVAQNVFIGCYTESTVTLPSLMNDNAVVIGGTWNQGFEPGAYTRIGTVYGSQGLASTDDTGTQVLRAFLDRGNGQTLLGFGGATTEGSVDIAWSYVAADTIWGQKWGGRAPGFYVTSKASFPSFGPGFPGVYWGQFVGNPSVGEHFWDGTYKSLTWLTDLRNAARLQGDRFRRDDATVGRWASRIVTVDGYKSEAWQAGMAASVESAPNAATHIETSGGQVWKATVAGTAHATTEPTWPGSPTPGVTTQTDNTITWTYVGPSATLGMTEKVESAHHEHTPQAGAKWEDSADTGTAAAKSYVRGWRRQASTTLATANQVIDAGATYSEIDCTIPDNALVHIEWLIVVKKSATGAGGTIKLEADYYRSGAGPVLIGSATPTYNLTGTTLDGTTVNLNINGNAIDLRASPESADTLGWTIIRTQTYRVD